MSDINTQEKPEVEEKRKGVLHDLEDRLETPIDAYSALFFHYTLSPFLAMWRRRLPRSL